MTKLFLIGFAALVMIQCAPKTENTTKTETPANKVEIRENKDLKSVEVYFDGSLFTSYIYPDNIMKPVLWPIKTSQSTSVTRNYPLEKMAGERTDHPHQVGLWFTYGDVNGLDYWNNSEAIPAEKKADYGTIFHREVLSTKAEGDKGVLKVHCEWVGHGQPELDEVTEFTFTNLGKVRIIDRRTTLTALVDVTMDDNKEGLIGMRVASQLEMPSDDEIILTDSHGIPTKVKGSNKLASGDYLSSEGITGDAVWGTRGEWMALTGNFDEEKVTVVMMDHPGNPGYPTYWHARGYGLFAANPLGQKELSGGKDELNFKLARGEKAVFQYRIIVSDDAALGENDWNRLANEFSK